MEKFFCYTCKDTDGVYGIMANKHEAWMHTKHDTVLMRDVVKVKQDRRTLIPQQSDRQIAEWWAKFKHFRAPRLGAMDH